MYHEDMRIWRVLILVSLASLISLGLILQSTTPSDVAPIGLLGVFALIYIGIVGITTGVIYMFSRIISDLATIMFRKNIPILRERASYLYGSVLAMAPVIYLAMSSVGSRGLGSIMLIVVFEVLAIFYISRRV